MKMYIQLLLQMNSLGVLWKLDSIILGLVDICHISSDDYATALMVVRVGT